MSAKQNKLIAYEWIRAFNEHDLQKLLSLYDEQAVHYSPKLRARLPESSGIINGKPALHNWWKDAFERLPSLRYELKNTIVSDQAVFMEYIRLANGEEPLAVGEVLETRNGLIICSRVYHG